MKSITMAMLIYANNNNGALVGNGWTTGAFLTTTAKVPYSAFNCPTVCGAMDWMTPVAVILGASPAEVDLGPTGASRTNRYMYLCNTYGPFQCPENQLVEAAASGSDFTGAAKAKTYVTSLCFQTKYGTKCDWQYQSYVNTGTYFPNVNRVGITSEKIWLAEGCPWNNGSGASTWEVSWNFNGSPGSDFAEWGPWDFDTRSYQPGLPMLMAMRHGIQKLGKNGSVDPSLLRLNAAFFDGHVETLDGLTASNPQYWCPSGTIVPTSEFWTNSSNPPVYEAYESKGAITIQ
jgi:prepilin-type processing-associated H-X9-DG protein